MPQINGKFKRRQDRRNMETRVGGVAVKRRRPAFADDPLMVGAFSGFIAWAATQPGIVSKFEQSSGVKFPFKRNERVERAMEIMMDDVYGVAEGVVVTAEQKEEIFNRWVNYLIKEYWGEDD